MLEVIGEIAIGLGGCALGMVIIFVVCLVHAIFLQPKLEAMFERWDQEDRHCKVPLRDNPQGKFELVM